MLWRSQKPRPLAPRVPAGFIQTSQPTLSPEPPAGPGWLHEIKFDGYRIIARREGDRVRVWSRHMTDFTDHFSGIAKAMRELPVNAVLDGEAVVLHEDGHSDFEALRGSSAREAILMSFDCLAIGGEDLRKQPVQARRARLAALLERAPEGVQFSQQIEGDGDIVFRQACAMGLEGIVSKRLGSFYRSGRCPNWLKTKNPCFARR